MMVETGTLVGAGEDGIATGVMVGGAPTFGIDMDIDIDKDRLKL
jgi:hypothetical protein